MLLVLEIFLTVIAWRKGWRAWALVPVAVTLFVGFLIGAAIQASGGSIQAAYPVALVADLACIGVLIGMATRTPRPAQLQEMTAARMSDEVPASHQAKA